MKSDIHPKYYPEASVRCACGNHWKTGATLPEISVEICDKCHPFYTGKEKLVDTRGRVDKFKKRASKSEEKIKNKLVKKPRLKKTSK
ncbi:MAG: 50S ribosomal protein L31 [Minisyncoccia bacterium]